MTFDYELTLIKLTYAENDMGDSISNEERITILCDVLSVTRAEHYQAASHGMKPEIVFIVNQYDYSKQTIVEFEGNKYRVIRDYKPKKAKGLEDFETIELVCEGVGNNAIS
ncbi:SPP1 family predicted phage head-tail adaptor [Neobacillus bataviensis]|uniref:SPP1 family predicted phage head-tail adaptor n=1 Tax=Neobacillus bataviensis TaxID=220685 RepID=A0A561DSQ3_9BACI|nr:phage head closure protein [Neobacillus bataviensis]TWE06405.1 SPP1 family predicted phage head-tail adaptor [Neobacillus bataviensis]